MDEKTLEALKGSIKKWERIVAGTDVDRGPDNCPLCHLFYLPVVARLMADRPPLCQGCPVYLVTGEEGCNGSPYEFYSYWDYDRVANESSPYSTRQDAAVAELEFLKGLLPKAEG